MGNCGEATDGEGSSDSGHPTFLKAAGTTGVAALAGCVSGHGGSSETVVQSAADSSAKEIEGTTRLGALFRVIMPLSAPCVATAGVLRFISMDNELFFGDLLTDGQAQHWAPIVWGTLNVQGQDADLYDLMAAAIIIGVLPVVLSGVIAQERIVSGLTAGTLQE